MVRTCKLRVRRICGRIERSEIRIARKLSILEPKVLLRNFPSVEQIQDESRLPLHKEPLNKSSAAPYYVDDRGKNSCNKVATVIFDYFFILFNNP